MNPKLKISIKILMAIILMSIALWFLFFKWHIVLYPLDPGYGPKICYSPNKEFFIKRYQTIFQSLDDPLYAEGVAILYNKSGKKLYKETAYLSRMFGPYWISHGNRFGVFYEGAGKEFGTELPSSPGEHPDRDRGCF